MNRNRQKGSCYTVLDLGFSEIGFDRVSSVCSELRPKRVYDYSP
jgi:hypothetical protein